MADGLNKVMLLGNLGAEPELRVTPSGQSILRLRLATTESYLDKSNERQERTEWHSVSVWGKRGEALSKILDKGSKIYVEGSIRTSTYEKDGEKRYRTEINATNIILCGGKPSGDGGQRETSRGGSSERRQPTQADKHRDDYNGADDFGIDDDIPF